MVKHRNSFLIAPLVVVSLFGGTALSGCGNNQTDTAASPVSTPAAASEGMDASHGANKAVPSEGSTASTSMSSPQNALNNPNISQSDKNNLREHMQNQQNQSK